MTKSSKILSLLLLLSLSVSCWLIFQVESPKEKEITTFSDDFLNFYKANRPTEYEHRKELFRLKRPLAFVTEVIVYLNQEKTGDDKVYIRAVIPEDMLDENWALIYGHERVIPFE